MSALARRDHKSDSGAAIVEFCYLGLILLIPLVYGMLIVFSVQQAAYAVTSAAREAGRAVAVAPSSSTLERDAYQAARIAAEDHDVELPPGSVTVSCTPPPCRQSADVRVDVYVDVRVEVQVRLPGVPVVMGKELASWKAVAVHSEKLGRFRAAGEKRG